MNAEEKFKSDLLKKCQSTSRNAVEFSSTRLFGHARLFPTRLAMRTVELAIGILTSMDRLERLEDVVDDDDNDDGDGDGDDHKFVLSSCFNTLDLVDRFINVFRPVTRLEFFAEAKTLEDGWMEALQKIDDTKQLLIKTLRSKNPDGSVKIPSTSWDVVEAEEEENRGSSSDRMELLFQSTREASQHVWGAQEYKTNIEFDVENKKNEKIKRLLDDIRAIAAKDKKSDTSQSIEAMLDATSVFDAFCRQYQLGCIMEKLAKKTLSGRAQIGETIQNHWETLGFDMDDDRAFDMIELFLASTAKQTSGGGGGGGGDDDGPSLDTEQRPRVFARACYVGTSDDVPNIERLCRQSKKSPDVYDEELHPSQEIELPDFSGPQSTAAQWRAFSIRMVKTFRLLKLNGLWVCMCV